MTKLEMQSGFAKELSSSFLVDVNDPKVKVHNLEVKKVWESFKADKPVRVPLTFTGARTHYLAENNVDYRTYYENPDEMFRLQLEWQRRACELPLSDTALGEVPECWMVSVDFHPVAMAASFGCPVIFRPDAVPAHESLGLSREECDNLVLPDLFKSGILPKHKLFSEHFDKLLAGGFTFLGRPVKRSMPTIPSTGGGIFSSALDIRGPEIMSDMYEDPEFVHRFLERLAEWQIALERAWTLSDKPDKPAEGVIEITDHGIDMLSPEIYDKFLASLLFKLAKKCDKKFATKLHHCGRGTQLFPLVKKRFGITKIHALTWPLNDVAKVRRELGYDIWIEAVISDNILRTTPEKIRQAAKEFFTPEVKGKGRLSLWAPGEVTEIPVENYLALYEAVKEYGKY